MFNQNRVQLLTAQVPLDKTKILIIYNSSNAQSKINADWYAAARGIDGGVAAHYQFLGFPFGAGDIVTTAYGSGTPIDGGALVVATNGSYANQYDGQALMSSSAGGQSAVASCIQDHSIQMVVVESLVPQKLFGPWHPGGAYGFQAVAPETFFARAVTLNALDAAARNSTRVTPRFSYLDSSHSVPSQLGRKWIEGNQELPCGRIGYFGCSTAELHRCVNDAIWAEGQDNRSKLHIVGGTNYTAGGNTAHMLLANARFHALLTSDSHLGYFSNEPTGAWQGTAGVYIFADYYNNVTPIPTPFGMLFSQNVGGTPTTVSARGGWAYDWCSGASTVGYASVQNNACAAIICADEPYLYGIPAVDAIAAALVCGMTMAESVFLSDLMTAANASCHGDPLYAPYKATPLVTIQESI